ncbi:NAD(P)H-dependent oxidoreductase [Salibacterium halotolerans]|uniref:NAD(P)H dehydrogenase (Quinone) n=1 Tax=Salibacterium halotolerans TaxID=1884432 RepID=A0A1I5T598_9BACI|nr:NAD(P)H-dependent oxidoreductase [Salibacterium halotolerans]SFP78183.1 NAD(P)H dehydrogenase (quinone) [Salibacterium halotolerans]
MKRVLIWFMHPDKNSFNGAVLNTLQEKLEQWDARVHVRWIPEMDISFQLTKNEYHESLHGKYPEEIRYEHSWIQWADAVLLVFPLWWGGFPAAGKGFLDRVLSYGFAYTMQEETPVPKMGGKKLGAVYTTGTPEEDFRCSRERLEAMWEEQIFSFCGFETLPFLQLGNVVQTNAVGRATHLKNVEKYAEEIIAASP